MASSIVGRIDHTLLESLVWSDESYTLGSFLDQYASSLPQVVKVFQGFRGDACSETIDSGQILILHSVHKETKILAKNAQGTEFFIPKDFQVKVEMIPKNCLEESTSIKELLQTFPKYFRTLSDIPSHGITSGSMFKIIRQKCYGCFECLQMINDGEEREVRLPFSLKGRFQALQDNREFLIDEVFAEERDNLEDGEPVNIHFVESCLSGISVPGLNVQSLYDLGTIRLVGERETQTVFASILSESGKNLAVFPPELEITVHAAQINEHYDSIRCTIKGSQSKTLKRIKRLNKLSLYQARNPVRQFCQTELEPPSLPSGRIIPAKQASIDSAEDKKGSNSILPPPRRVPLETKHKKGVSTSRPASVCGKNASKKKENISPKRPNYKPPDIPYESQPPLPPKERSRSLIEDKEQDLVSGQQGPKEDDPESPPIPPPRSRRRQKSIGKRIDVKKSSYLSTGYEQMDGFAQDQEYVEMVGTWREKEATLEEIFSDDADDTYSSATEVTANGKHATIESKVSSSDANNSRIVNEMVILPRDVSEQRERADSMDYENTKELKLDGLKKKISDRKVSQNHEDEVRQRVDSWDYENTKELKIERLKNAKISGKTGHQNDADEERQRLDSWDYENTKELKIKRLKNAKISGKTGPGNDTENQRERSDSMDYENTKELKLVNLKKNREMVLQNDEDEQRERKDSLDYENTKELKLDHLKNLKISGKTVSQMDPDDQRDRQGTQRRGSLAYENTKELKVVPPGKRTSTVSDDIGEDDSTDYENTKELKLKTPNKTKQNRAVNTNEPINGKDKRGLDMRDAERSIENQKDGGENGSYKTGQTCTSEWMSQLILSSSNDARDTNVKRTPAEDESHKTQARSESETLSDFVCRKNGTVAKTEQFLKHLRLGEVSSGSDVKPQPEGSNEEYLAEETNNRASVGIYYTTMADNVADHPSYYTTMAENSFLHGDVYESMSADDLSYVPMNASYTKDESIYENDDGDNKGSDSDDMEDYENVTLVCTPHKKIQVVVDKDVDVKHFSDAYEEVDIVHKIESSLDKNPSSDHQGRDEKKEMSQMVEVAPSSRGQRVSDVYEEIDPLLDPGSNRLDVVARERPGSETYEDIDFPLTTAAGHLAKTVSSDTSAPPTPPQRRAKKLRKEAKVDDSAKDQTKVLPSSPKDCDHIAQRQREDFEDLDSLQVHMAIKDSERQFLFEKALLYKNTKQQTPNSELPEESCKDKVSISAVDKVADQYVKSRPPAPPPPRKPVTYLDVEPTRKPTKPFEPKPVCNYSEVIGQVQPKHSSSREDDMEYIDDIDLHYFQKESMEMEKKRKEEAKEKNKSGKDSLSNDVKTKETVNSSKIPNSGGIDTRANGEYEIENSVTANIQKFQNEFKDGFQDTKKPGITKLLPKKPLIKKKPKRALSDPKMSKNDVQKATTSSNSSHDSNVPITSQDVSHDAHKPITLSLSSLLSNRPITSSSSPSNSDNLISSLNNSRDAKTPITSATCPSVPDVNRPITSQTHSSIAPKPNTPEHQSRATKQPITRQSSEKPAIARKPILAAKRSPNPPPKPKRTFDTENTSDNSKAYVPNTLNTQKTRVSSNTVIQDTPAVNGKGSQSTVQKQSSSEEKGTSPRTRPPKPLPRRKSQI